MTVETDDLIARIRRNGVPASPKTDRPPLTYAWREMLYDNGPDWMEAVRIRYADGREYNAFFQYSYWEDDGDTTREIHESPETLDDYSRAYAERYNVEHPPISASEGESK